MKLFIDSADVSEIRRLAQSGLVDGVTTNPSLIAKSGGDIAETIAEICSIVPGPISAEVLSIDYEIMVTEGRKLAKIADNVVVKLPLTWDGLRACKVLSDEGTQVNVTVCFSAAQAMLAAKAGATFVSPFVGRLNDIGSEGMELIDDICTIFSQYPEFETEVLVASVRQVSQVVDAGRMGAHAATLPPKIFEGMFMHPLTDKAIKTFVEDAEKSGQKIL